MTKSMLIFNYNKLKIKMKKVLFAAALSFLFFKSVVAVEIDPEKINGDPNENANHFIWDVMAELQTPDDEDCLNVASSELQDLGLTEEEASEPATMACDALSSMRTEMESGMGNGQESIETNLFEAADWHAVENLYFEHSINGTPDGRIAFSVPIDFMSYSFMNFMMSFGENMDANRGYISLDADVVGGFADYGAVLTMYNVPEFDNPKILVNGEDDNAGVVSNLVYDKENNTITFSAAHFTEFEVVEDNEKPKIDYIKVRKYYNPKSGKWIVKMIIKGDDYNNNTEVKVGNRKPYKTKYKNKNKIIVNFSLDKLLMSGRDNFVVKVINGDESEKFKKKLRISTLENSYSKL